MSGVDKLAGIKPGDRVRVTFEGSYRPGINGFFILLDGTGRAHEVGFANTALPTDTFQIERIEPPLKVGDNVTGRPGCDDIGLILAIYENRAWVRWPFVANPCTVSISDLERIA